ncbi:hypothetical protein E2986_08151 [Frieseomelitta varia]|uniref:Nuclear nucleic acid-binding protein C1D n=1 Tax=Frieseomelitta varia TaxID=561572 RepID=A0A833W0S1_9HYME|nr:nuclear nucleic acid-binding protein C1D-like [Frieseomelitta varia]XP_043513880.1 nuclear nucleic acid-binding protein C1D-like [Frieseomelitta varia]KAF3430000.1 hypothetical protein E2986_08151 [Frieseomelitta varia]
MDANFGERSHDPDVIEKLKQFHDAATKIEDKVKHATDPTVYEKLSNTDKIEYNLLMSYCLNSVFWMYLRSEGIDPSKHRIKQENDRLKKSMARAKQINDKKTIMPHINKDAAQRFVRHGLWELKNKKK